MRHSFRQRPISEAPPGIGKKLWKSWKYYLDEVAKLEEDEKTLIMVFRKVTDQMVAILSKIEPPKFDSDMWEEAARHCVDLVWDAVNKVHNKGLPEMACQRSGRCCEKQVPRVSAYEMKRMAEHLSSLDEPIREKVLEQCKESVLAEYSDPILGVGVPCPMLIKDDKGVPACSVHQNRPLICRVSGVSTHLSWDCPIWKIHGTYFPTMTPAAIAPLLDLFAYARYIFGTNILNSPELVQMGLIGPTMLLMSGREVPEPKQVEVTNYIAHQPGWSPELYCHKLPAPPEETVNADD